jgi:hypothetical protein
MRWQPIAAAIIIQFSRNPLPSRRALNERIPAPALVYPATYFFVVSGMFTRHARRALFHWHVVGVVL